jgi:FG-GAP repeat
MNATTVSSSAGVGNVGGIWSVAATGDYNGDGKTDILWTDTSGNTVMWLMNGAVVSSSAFLGNIPTTWKVQSANAE